MNIKYKHLLEALDRSQIGRTTIFHASPIQNLDKIRPWDSENNKALQYRSIYASDDPAYASAFTFKHPEGVNILKKDGKWTIVIPIKLKPKLKNQFCSMYTLDTKYFSPIGNHTRYPDHVSPFADIPPLQEDQFASPLDAMKKYGLQIEWSE